MFTGCRLCRYNDDAMLINCVDDNNLELVKYLIEHGANIHARDDYAIRHSARKGYADIVSYLIGKGANIHACNDYALRWAQRKCDSALLNPGSMPATAEDLDKIIKYLTK